MASVLLAHKCFMESTPEFCPKVLQEPDLHLLIEKSYLPIWGLALPSVDCVVLMALGKALCCLLAERILFDSEEFKIYILKHILFNSQNPMNLTSSVCLQISVYQIYN